jgi:hypothetical protein
MKQQRQRALADKRREKAAKKLEAKARRASSTRAADGEDPDIAGIVPGPQPIPDEFAD